MSETIAAAPGVSLRALLPGARLFGGPDIQVTSCCGHWRECQPGDLFTALEQADGDGHDEAFAAIKRGASAVLAERLLPVTVPTCVVPDSREAFGRVCHALAGDPSRDLATIGVAGTYGKTIVSLLLGSILETAGASLGLLSSLGATDGESVMQLNHAEPTAAELAHWAQRVRTNEATHGIVELSSIALAQRRAAGMRFNGVVLTNIRRSDLDFHGSVVNYRQAISQIFSHLKPGGFAVVNADDAPSARLLDKLEVPVLTIGLHGEAELTAQVLERQASEQTFLISAGDETIPVSTRMIGDHHVYNCLSAAAVGLLLGIDLRTIVRGLESVDRVPGRLERIECGQPFSTFVDSAHTADSLAASLKALRQVTRGRLICVYGAEGGVRKDERPLLGRAVERCADLGIITTDRPGDEPPHEIAHDIIDGYAKAAKAHPLPDRARAIEYALSQAGPGDTVVIAGKGELPWANEDSRREEGDDADVVREWLFSEGARPVPQPEWN